MKLHERVDKLEESVRSFDERLKNVEKVIGARSGVSLDDFDDSEFSGAVQEVVEAMDDEDVDRLEREIQEIRFELGLDPVTRPKLKRPGGKTT